MTISKLVQTLRPFDKTVKSNGDFFRRGLLGEVKTKPIVDVYATKNYYRNLATET